MEIFEKIFENLRIYLKYLLKDIRNLTFRNLKPFLIKNKILILLVIILFSVIVGFNIGSYKASKDILLKNFEVAMKENKPEKIYKKVKLSGRKISKNELKPLAEYYYENPQQVSEIVKELKSSGESNYFSLINKKILFFDNYYLDIKPVSIKVNSNFDEAKIYINEVEISENNTKSDLIPGKYLIKGELDTLYGQVEQENKVYIMEDLEYNLDIPAINISLTSNFNDATVFINNKNINKNVKDVKNFGPIPLNKDIAIYLEKELPWGVVRSEEVKVGNLPNINIEIDIANDQLISDVNKALKNFYESVFEALNKSDYNLIKNSREDAKSKIYDSIVKESLFFKNNYEINDLKTEIEKSEFYFEDEIYKGKIVVKLNYKIKKKILPFIQEDVDEMFLTNIEYENGKWIINDVQKFNLE